jgi:hypothetical protein
MTGSSLVRAAVIAVTAALVSACGGGGGDTPPGPTCTYALSDTSLPVATGGDAGSVDITAGAGCAWIAATPDEWITLAGSTTGSGDGTVEFTVDANPNGPERVGTITAGGRTLTITQPGLGCDATLSASSAPAAATGGSGTVTVTVAPRCTWTAVPVDGWLSVTAGASGSGSGTVQYLAAANPSSLERAGRITVAGEQLSVVQAGAPCTYALLPESASFAAASSGATVQVAAPGGCAWTATSPVGWIAVTSGASGSGNGTVQLSVAANAAGSSRAASLTIAGLSFAVSQGGAACTYSVAPPAATVAASPGSGSFGVTAPSGCSWGASSGAAWISVTAGSVGSGNGGVQYEVEANPASASRQGTVTVAGQTHTVTQTAAACAVALSPGSASYEAAGGVGSFAVTTPIGCGWSASSSAPWLTLGAAGPTDRSGTVGFTVGANPTALSRSATITVGGQPFTVTQGGVGCSYALSATEQSLGSGGASGTVDVVAPGGCSWSATSGAPWITIVAGGGGAGDGTVQYEVLANPTGLERIGTLTIAGRAYTVTQDAAPCTYALVPETASFPPEAGAGSVAVDTLEGCAWSAASDAGWLAVVGGAAGTGDGAVRFSLAENGGSGSRTGSLTVAGKTFTVAQGGVGCSYALSAPSATFGAAAGAGSVGVTAAGGCTWTASADVAWITITSGGAGAGNGTIAYAVAANPTTTPRSGTLTVAGQAHTVSQAGATCSYALLPASGSYPPAGAVDSFAVSAPRGCAWSAASGAGWVTVTAGATGDGPGTVAFTVATNGAAASRSAAIALSVPTGPAPAFDVAQGGAGCTYDLAPTARAAPAAGATDTASVTAPAGCAWTAASDVPWIAIDSGSTGSGNGTVGYSVAANPSTSERIGTATIAGRTLTVTQAPAACTFAISPDTTDLSAAPSSGAISVSTQPGCAWTATSQDDWLSVTGGASGSGSGLVAYEVEANLGTVDRQGALTVAGRTFTVLQGWGSEVVIIIQ